MPCGDYRNVLVVDLSKHHRLLSRYRPNQMCCVPFHPGLHPGPQPLTALGYCVSFEWMETCLDYLWQTTVRFLWLWKMVVFFYMDGGVLALGLGKNARFTWTGRGVGTQALLPQPS